MAFYKFEAKDKKMLDYTDGHIARVNQACKKYSEQILKSLGIPGSESDLFHRCISHDRSKYSEEEFLGYRMHFDPKQGDPEEADKEWKMAWNHHQKTNDHHPEYWILIDDDTHEKDDKTKSQGVSYSPLPMPRICIAEMLCDWASFTNSTPRIWFRKNQQYYAQIMHPETYRLVDKVTKEIWGD